MMIYDGDRTIIQRYAEIGWANIPRFHVFDNPSGTLPERPWQISLCFRCLLLHPAVIWCVNTCSLESSLKVHSAVYQRTYRGQWCGTAWFIGSVSLRCSTFGRHMTPSSNIWRLIHPPPWRTACAMLCWRASSNKLPFERNGRLPSLIGAPDCCEMLLFFLHSQAYMTNVHPLISGSARFHLDWSSWKTFTLCCQSGMAVRFCDHYAHKRTRVGVAQGEAEAGIMQYVEYESDE